MDMLKTVCPDGGVVVLKDIYEKVQDALLGELPLDNLVSAIGKKEDRGDVPHVTINPFLCLGKEQGHAWIVGINRVRAPDDIQQ